MDAAETQANFRFVIDYLPFNSLLNPSLWLALRLHHQQAYLTPEQVERGI